jgi:DNA-binding PadR family transcriptional regulator
MKGSYIGELEELILLTVGILYREAYGVAIREELKNQTGRDINISAIHAVLKRLEDKGFLNSSMGGATSERGGRRKRMFNLTDAGKRVLTQSVEQRNRMFHTIPEFAWKMA